MRPRVSRGVGGERGRGSAVIAAEALMSSTSTLSSWQPDGLTPAQIAAVSHLARYSGPTHKLYAYQLRRWFGWCDATASTRSPASNAPMSSCTSAGSPHRGYGTPRSAR